MCLYQLLDPLTRFKMEKFYRYLPPDQPRNTPSLLIRDYSHCLQHVWNNTPTHTLSWMQWLRMLWGRMQKCSNSTWYLQGRESNGRVMLGTFHIFSRSTIYSAVIPTLRPADSFCWLLPIHQTFHQPIISTCSLWLIEGLALLDDYYQTWLIAQHSIATHYRYIRTHLLLYSLGFISTSYPVDCMPDFVLPLVVVVAWGILRT
jgi:hypothetical protein